MENQASAEESNIIDTIYKTMSQIIETINMDNLILNRQISNAKDDLEHLKIEGKSLHEKFDKCLHELSEIKKKLNMIDELQKNVLETRNTLLQTLNLHMKNMKKELCESHLTKDKIRMIVMEELHKH